MGAVDEKEGGRKDPPGGGARPASGPLAAEEPGGQQAGVEPVRVQQAAAQQELLEQAAARQDAVEQAATAQSEVELPRGASGAELDTLRVSLRKQPRTLPPGEQRVRLPDARAPSLPPPAGVLLKPELDRLVDEGRALLDADARGAHALFERAWLRNLNDPRVLSHYGLTLVLVEGDRQRGIRFCEEALRRGPPTSEYLVNLARALVQTRNKEQAVRALARAQELAPDDPRVRAEFDTLGLRRRPPIPFLPRDFFLNRWLGRLTWRIFRRRAA